MGEVHLLEEMMVVHFDGGEHRPRNGETAMSNSSNKIIRHKTGLAEPDRGTGKRLGRLLDDVDLDARPKPARRAAQFSATVSD